MARNTRRNPNSIPIDRLRKAVSYCPSSGEFVWLSRDDVLPAVNTRFAGRAAFTTSSHGYKTCRIDGVSLLAHRCAWAIAYGSWPNQEIDHINGIKSDNRLCNLRLVSFCQQAKNQKLRRNNASGFNGVSQVPQTGRWRSRIKVDGRQINLGVYGCKTAAFLARKIANAKYGFHQLHGEPK